jgi:hypothetical protein
MVEVNQPKGVTETMTSSTTADIPALTAAIPVLMTRDLKATVGFFERLQFSSRYDDGSYAILGRDEVELHFGHQEGLDPKRTCTSAASMCEILKAYSPASLVTLFIRTGRFR